jgi:hypothetical protein
MRNAKDCLILAQAMERRALHCATPILRAEMLSMARSWREIALQALWQDHCGANTPAT